jgi:hypothetical protein
VLGDIRIIGGSIWADGAAAPRIAEGLPSGLFSAMPSILLPLSSIYLAQELLTNVTVWSTLVPTVSMLARKRVFKRGFQRKQVQPIAILTSI